MDNFGFSTYPVLLLLDWRLLICKNNLTISYSSDRLAKPAFVQLEKNCIHNALVRMCEYHITL